MKRREFITALSGTLILPIPAQSQPKQPPGATIGWLGLGNPAAPINVRVSQAFQQGLREDGYIEGQNVRIERRYGAGLEDLERAAGELVRMRVDVILASGTPAALAARRATDAIPIVGAVMADPLADGLVASLARPGGNITGNTFIGPELGPKRLQLLREMVPGVLNVAALQHPGVYGERTMKNMLTELQHSATDGGIEIQVVSAAAPEAFDSAFEAMVSARAGALIVFPSPMFYQNYRRLVELATYYRLPSMFVFREAVEAGGLACYGADIPYLSRHSAQYVAKILRGTKPGDLPVEQPTKFEFAVNLKSAKALGLRIPPTLLARADEVIE